MPVNVILYLNGIVYIYSRGSIHKIKKMKTSWIFVYIFDVNFYQGLKGLILKLNVCRMVRKIHLYYVKIYTSTFKLLKRKYKLNFG